MPLTYSWPDIIPLLINNITTKLSFAVKSAKVKPVYRLKPGVRRMRRPWLLHTPYYIITIFSKTNNTGTTAAFCIILLLP